jgi:hypothetical protein
VIRRWPIGLIGLLVAASASAAGAQSPLEPFGFKGVITYKNFSFFEDTPNDGRNIRNEGALQLEWARRLAPWVSARIVGEARIDDDDYAEGVTFRIPETNRHRSYLGVREATVRFEHGPMVLTLGKQLFAWGTADGFNPTDNLNPYDYLDVADAEKMAIWSAAAQLTLGPTNTTLIVAPVFTPSRTPFLTSRWVPPAPSDILLADRQLPANTVSNVTYAARVRATVSGWDLSASYFEGFENTPVVETALVSPAPGVTMPLLTPVFTRMRVVGLDASTTYRKFEFHGEAAAKFVARDGPRDRFQAIVGLNYTFDELDLRWLERVNVILEYAREVTLATHAGFNGGAGERVNDAVRLPNNAYSNAILARALFRFTEDTQLVVGGTVDLSASANFFVRVALSHRVTDRLHLDAGLDIFGGPATTFWGRWDANDRAFVFVRYFF